MDDWWKLDDSILVHALNYAGSECGVHRKSKIRLIPDEGILACSVASKNHKRAYSSEGLILKKTNPLKVSYCDVGSYTYKDDDGNMQRHNKGPMWGRNELPEDKLMYLSILYDTYNEVFVDSKDIEIEAFFGRKESVDEFVDELVECIDIDPSFEYSGFYMKNLPSYLIIADTLTKIDKYLHMDTWISERKRNNDFARGILFDVARKNGFESKDNYGVIRELESFVLENEIDMKWLLPEVAPYDVFGGMFEFQEITDDHKNLLTDAMHEFVNGKYKLLHGIFEDIVNRKAGFTYRNIKTPEEIVAPWAA